MVIRGNKKSTIDKHLFLSFQQIKTLGRSEGSFLPSYHKYDIQHIVTSSGLLCIAFCACSSCFLLFHVTGRWQALQG